MYTLSFEKFTNPDYFPKQNIVLYVVRDNSDIFYVGISRAGVWNRWFGWSGRMVKNIYDEWVTHDSIGNHIVRNMPKSLKWSIDLWTVKEAIEFLGSPNTVLEDVENELIAALFPSINITGNSKDFRSEYKGIRLKGYLEYVKCHKEKVVKQSVVRARKKVLDFGKLDVMELLPEDDIPF